MATGTLLLDLHLPYAGNLKEKRAVVRHLLDACRHRYRVAASEVGALDLTQRSELAFAAVSAAVAHVEDVLDEVERFVLSHPEIELLRAHRVWSEDR